MTDAGAAWPLFAVITFTVVHLCAPAWFAGAHAAMAAKRRDSVSANGELVRHVG